MAKRKPASRKVFPRGLTIAYVGNGKGKTTAAVGAAVRARGYGLPVLFIQFYKSTEWPSGERQVLAKAGVCVKVFGKGFVGILGDTKKLIVHKKSALQALVHARKAIFSGKYRLVILDEVISCIEQKLFPQSKLIHLLKVRKNSPTAFRVHVVLTGHTKYPSIIRYCDLVTEMKMIKHPYYQGYLAVKGIDF